MTATLLLVWPLVLGQVAFVETSDGPCPEAPQVEQRVRGILGLGPEDTLEERALLSRDGEQLKVVVTRKDGSVLGDKSLDGAASCEELEALVAVVIATWISDLHPEFLATLPAAPSRAEMPAEVPPPPAPESQPVPAPSAPSPAPLLAPTAPVANAAPVAQRFRFELGAGAGVAVAGGASALASLGARWAPERWGVGAAVSAHLTTAREEALSAGRVSYWRWPIVLGPLLRLHVAPFHVDAHAGLALGWLRAEGQDFQPSFTRDVFRGGGVASVRAAYGRGAVRPFLEASAVVWAETEAFVQRGDEERSVRLPSLELYATLGLAWSL